MSRGGWVITLLIIGLMIPMNVMATNGDNLIGVGPISRAMGGVGIAAPQDAISAVFSNPAAMCHGAFCPSNQVDFAGTGFMPNIHASIKTGTGPFGAFFPPVGFNIHSDPKLYPIPALGISYSFPELPELALRLRRLWRHRAGSGLSGRLHGPAQLLRSRGSYGVGGLQQPANYEVCPDGRLSS